MNANETILQTMTQVAENTIKKLDYDITKICTVVDASESGFGRYKVSNGLTTFFAVANNLNEIYQEEDIVRVVIPNGNYNNKKFIVGYQNIDEYKKIIYSEAKKSFVPIDELTENKPVSCIIPLNVENELVKTITFSTKDLNLSNALLYNSIYLEFDSFINKSNLTAGTYEIEINLYYKNAEEKPKQTYYFSSLNFLGNPYSVLSLQKQWLIVLDNLVDLVQIEINFIQNQNFYTAKNEKAAGFELYINNLKLYLGQEYNGQTGVQLYNVNSDTSFNKENADVVKNLVYIWYRTDDNSNFLGFAGLPYGELIDEEGYLRQKQYEDSLSNLILADTDDLYPKDLEGLDLQLNQNSLKNVLSQFSTKLKNFETNIDKLLDEYTQNYFYNINYMDSLQTIEEKAEHILNFWINSSNSYYSVLQSLCTQGNSLLKYYSFDPIPTQEEQIELRLNSEDVKVQKGALTLLKSASLINGQQFQIGCVDTVSKKRALAAWKMYIKNYKKQIYFNSTNNTSLKNYKDVTDEMIENFEFAIAQQEEINKLEEFYRVFSNRIDLYNKQLNDFLVINQKLNDLNILFNSIYNRFLEAQNLNEQHLEILKNIYSQKYSSVDMLPVIVDLTWNDLIETLNQWDNEIFQILDNMFNFKYSSELNTSFLGTTLNFSSFYDVYIASLVEDVKNLIRYCQTIQELGYEVNNENYIGVRLKNYFLQTLQEEMINWEKTYTNEENANKMAFYFCIRNKDNPENYLILNELGWDVSDSTYETMSSFLPAKKYNSLLNQQEYDILLNNNCSFNFDLTDYEMNRQVECCVILVYNHEIYMSNIITYVNEIIYNDLAQDPHLTITPKKLSQTTITNDGGVFYKVQGYELNNNESFEETALFLNQYPKITTNIIGYLPTEDFLNIKNIFTNNLYNKTSISAGAADLLSCYFYPILYAKIDYSEKIFYESKMPISIGTHANLFINGPKILIGKKNGEVQTDTNEPYSLVAPTQIEEENVLYKFVYIKKDTFEVVTNDNFMKLNTTNNLDIDISYAELEQYYPILEASVIDKDGIEYKIRQPLIVVSEEVLFNNFGTESLTTIFNNQFNSKNLFLTDNSATVVHSYVRPTATDFLMKDSNETVYNNITPYQKNRTISTTSQLEESKINILGKAELSSVFPYFTFFSDSEKGVYSLDLTQDPPLKIHNNNSGIEVYYDGTVCFISKNQPPIRIGYKEFLNGDLDIIIQQIGVISDGEIISTCNSE